MTSSAPETGLPPDHLVRQLLDAIAEHPEVREPLLRALLTEDFLTLPRRVEKLEGEFQEFREETRAGFRAVNERIDATNAEVRVLGNRLDENTRRLDEFGNRLDENTRRLDEFGNRLDENTGRLDEFGNRLDENTVRLDEFGNRLDENTRRLDENTRAIRRMEGHVGRLIGNIYEDLCRREIGVILDGWLKAPVLADRELVNTKLLRARESGAINREDYLNGLRPDIIARGNGDAGHAGPLAIVEVSVTFNQNDLENAARRAAIISGVTGNSVAAFVATHDDWPDEVNTVAGALGVNIIRHEDPDHVDPL